MEPIAFGGDYNPEQWPADVWPEDARLMREAGVNLVTVNVFGWAHLEPAEGRYEFGWLDRVMDLMHEHGIRVDLATGTASPPPWFSRRYPETLPQTADGRRLCPGARQAFCPSSPIYLERAVALAGALAERYADHPALALWHVHNEYGCHNARCYCDASAEAFRGWLRERYGTLDALNEAWGTAFWSQRYYDWAEILPPRAAPTYINPTQRMDFDRFSSDQFLACFGAEKAALRRYSADTPVTTNYLPHPYRTIDYWSWRGAVDVVAIDHYLRVAEPDPHVNLAITADAARSYGGGAPWLLMEHSTSAVNWQPRNRAKRPGEMRRNSLAHLARGADGILFFQWRQSRAGAEKFHSAMLPHAGTGTRVWREVVELGALLGRLAEVRGTRVDADVAIVFDWDAWWAGDQDAHPSQDVRYAHAVRDLHASLWRVGVTADLAPPSADLSRYRLVLVPGLYLVTDADAANIAGYVAAGGHALVTYFSGIVDEHDHLRTGGYPGAFRELLGVWTEEFHPLLKGETVRLDDSATGRIWTEHLHPRGAEVVASYADGPLPGVPAITRRAHGDGVAWYLATSLAGADLDRLLRRLCDEAGVGPAADAPPGVEVVRRRGPSSSYLFVLNHTDAPVTVPAGGTDLVTGDAVTGRVEVPSGGVAVVREAGETTDE